MKASLTNRIWKMELADCAFEWDLARDFARLTNRENGGECWCGSLLPLWWIVDVSGAHVAVQPSVQSARWEDNELHLELDLQAHGSGSVRVVALENGVSLERVAVNWSRAEVRVIGLYFGCQILTAPQRSAVPTLERPFWPNWRAEGFCIASAKTAPMQSFFRRWDFGHTNIPLGSFGPAMGTPYAAAFPRPLYAGCMGGRNGWVCLGTGSIPDAALSWQVRSSSGAHEWLYREDLWAPPVERSRQWLRPLRLVFAATAWLAYRDYFRTLVDVRAPKDAAHQKSFWGTWGDFRFERFDIPAAVDRALDEVETPLVCIDDPWESFTGSGVPHEKRLPNFAQDIEYGHRRGAKIGIWLPLVWIARPELAGLTDEDLIQSRDGAPIQGMWCMDPHDPDRWCSCMDPSSKRVREYIRMKTRRVMERYRPALLKIDFGYGVPGPDACAPRDPSLRGERLSYTLARLVADAAREVDSSVTIMYVTLNPLWDDVQDLCGMDDLGDAGPYEAVGHGHWSVWAALLGDRGVGVMASSGYDWHADAEVLLDTAVIGAPGANLPRQLEDGEPVPAEYIARRRALARWHRRTTQWSPCWLNTSSGDLRGDPVARCWGRMEFVRGGEHLTAVALRGEGEEAALREVGDKLSWRGRWALLAQGDGSIFDAMEVACVPFSPGEITLVRPRPVEVQWVTKNGAVPHGGWRWREGQLTIEVDEEQIRSGGMGVLVRTKSNL